MSNNSVPGGSAIYNAMMPEVHPWRGELNLQLSPRKKKAAQRAARNSQGMRRDY